MKKLLLTLMLAVVSSSAMAKWVKVSEDKLVTAYADPTTIRKNGDKVKMWALWATRLRRKVVQSRICQLGYKMNTIAKKRLTDKSLQPSSLTIWPRVIQLTCKGVKNGYR